MTAEERADAQIEGLALVLRRARARGPVVAGAVDQVVRELLEAAPELAAAWDRRGLRR